MSQHSVSRRNLIQKSLIAGVSIAQAAPVFIASSVRNVHAQTATDYPSKPVKIIVGFPAGGGTDVFARALAQGLQAQLGGSFVVENKPGAGGVLASTGMLQTPADGLTLLLGSTSTQVIAPLLYAKRPYTPTDFTPIAHVASVGIVLVANPNAPFNNVAELVNYARQRPGQLNYASGGNGVTNHLAMELLKSRTNTFITHIPYRGSAPALQDVIGGQVPLMFDSIAASGPQIRSGKVKALGIAGLQRLDALPGVPTISEAGANIGLRDFDTSGWVALYAPKALPASILSKLQDATAKILAQSDVIQRFAAAGAQAKFMNAAELTAYEAAETRKWSEAVKYSGAKID
ncbi:tripartite tricarboxylate transporter substrate binding protein [Variovorax sp. PCZ-1]|uniref:Bug family tripartite tricarboxylate transporter substrate binding protein n=1 Tax=Variovorax sp. PCZ-1 TaxID=2835533 RepID=UPI001BCE8864|nr:tripartite tricarboxylate transporter substrate binding protein [Variovorax sp. PCZ-1]MBS7807014.1 tripartite tricarboxylate transporter substrate binding protein [Variovorax sp. PCZ-1]